MKTYKELLEKINIARAKMSDVITDFQDSDAPQFEGKSAEKMKKEEVEELDELSTDTLRSYRNKARDDAFDAHDVDDDRRLRKRSYGANQAGKKILKRGEPLRKEEVEQTDEALTGNQHKIDANKNGKIDGHDFKILRNAKKARYQ
jgi:uncharacterized Fe-S cluster-containing protein